MRIDPPTWIDWVIEHDAPIAGELLRVYSMDLERQGLGVSALRERLDDCASLFADPEKAVGERAMELRREDPLESLLLALRPWAWSSGMHRRIGYWISRRAERVSWLEAPSAQGKVRWELDWEVWREAFRHGAAEARTRAEEAHSAGERAYALFLRRECLVLYCEILGRFEEYEQLGELLDVELAARPWDLGLARAAVALAIHRGAASEASRILGEAITSWESKFGTNPGFGARRDDPDLGWLLSDLVPWIPGVDKADPVGNRWRKIYNRTSDETWSRRPRLFLELFQLQLELGTPDATVLCLEVIEVDDPRVFRVLAEFLPKLLNEHGVHGTVALDILRIAHRHEPEAHPLTLHLAQRLRVQQHWVEAQILLSELGTRDDLPKHIRAALDAEGEALGRARVEAQKNGSPGAAPPAISSLRAAHEADPDDPVRALSLAQALEAERAFEGALEVGRRILETYPSNIVAGELVERALTALDRMEDLERALEARWRATDAGPSRDEISMRLAEFAYFRGEQKRVDALISPLEVRPPKQNPTRSISHWYLAHGELARARGSLDVQLEAWERDLHADEGDAFEAAEERLTRLRLLNLEYPRSFWGWIPQNPWGRPRSERLGAVQQLIRDLRMDPGLELFAAATREYFEGPKHGLGSREIGFLRLGTLAVGEPRSSFEALEAHVDTEEWSGYWTPLRVAVARAAGEHEWALELLEEQAARYSGDPERFLSSSAGWITEPQALLGERIQLASVLGWDERAQSLAATLDASERVEFNPSLLTMLSIEDGRVEEALARLREPNEWHGRFNPWFSALLYAKLSASRGESESGLKRLSGMSRWSSNPPDEFVSFGALTVEELGPLRIRMQQRIGDADSLLEHRLAALQRRPEDPERWIELNRASYREGHGEVYVACLDGLARVGHLPVENRIAWFDARARVDPEGAVEELLAWFSDPEPRPDKSADSERAAMECLLRCLGRLDASTESFSLLLDELAQLESMGSRVRTWLDLDRSLDPRGERPLHPRIAEALARLDPEVRGQEHRERVRLRARSSGDPRAVVLDRLDRLQEWSGFVGPDLDFPERFEDSGLGEGLRIQLERNPRDVRAHLAMAYGEWARGEARAARDRLLEFEEEFADHAGLRGALWTLHRDLEDAEAAGALELDWVQRVRRGSAWSPGGDTRRTGEPREALDASAAFLVKLRKLEGRGDSDVLDGRLVLWRVSDLDTADPVRPERPDWGGWESFDWSPDSAVGHDKVLGRVGGLLEQGRYREAADRLRDLELSYPSGPPGHRAYGLTLASSGNPEEVDHGLRVLWREYLRPFEDAIEDFGASMEDRAPFLGGPRGGEVDALLRASIVVGREEELLDRLALLSGGSEYAPHFGSHRVRDGRIRAMMLLGQRGQALGLIREARGAEPDALDLRRLEVSILMSLDRFDEALLLQRNLHAEQLRRGPIPDSPRLRHLTNAPARMRFNWGERHWSEPTTRTLTIYTPADSIHEGRRLAVILARLGLSDEYAALMEELLSEGAQGSRSRALEGMLDELVASGLEDHAIDLIVKEASRPGVPRSLNFAGTWGALLPSSVSKGLRRVVVDQAREFYGDPWVTTGPNPETVLELLVGRGLEPEVAERRLRRVRALEPREPHWVILEARRLDGLGKGGEALALLDRWVLLELAHGEEIPPEVDAWRGLIGHRIAPSKRSRAQLARAWVEGLGWRSAPDGWRRRMEGELRGALGW